MSALEKPKAIFSPRWLVSVGALAVCGAAFGYVTGDWFAERFPHGGGFGYLAERGYPPLTIISASPRCNPVAEPKGAGSMRSGASACTRPKPVATS